MIIDYSKEPISDIAFIDMKSFYASVECIERGLNPLTTSLCVMSYSSNSKGLILASSPTFKQVFGKNNVGRAYDLPFNIETRRFNFYRAKQQGIKITSDYINYIENWAKKTFIVPPRMGLYIQKNMAIQQILKNYASIEDILPYSIDEAFVDLTASLNYFIPDKTISKKNKLDILSSNIQKNIYEETGLYSTIGMSNSNPLLAKLALDIEAKHTTTMRANWSYEDVPTKVWQIKNMSDFWGIGARTEKRLNKLGITNIYQLANYNPDILKQELGIIGLQLWFHANGVDESNVHNIYRPKEKGIGNSQILPKDYTDKEEIEIVLKEMAEQVAIRLRKINKKACCVSIYIGYSKNVTVKPLQAQKKIDPTQSTRKLTQSVLELFYSKYIGEPIRQISIRYHQLVEEEYSFYSLFEDPEITEKEEKLEKTVDAVRQKYGFLSLQRATVLTSGSRNINRSQLIGGHSAGGLDGLE